MQIQIEQTKRELKIRNYSSKTIKSYLACLKEYLLYCKNDLKSLNPSIIKKFLLEKQEKGYSPQTINLYLNTIKFFYRNIVKTAQRIDLKFVKRTKKLPIILSRYEIADILSVLKNYKHRLLIVLSYGSGLRVSEIRGTRG